jgi:fatty acid desaturase
MNTLFRYPADRLPIFFILSLTLLDLLVYFTADNIWLLLSYFILTIIPKGCTCAWNHHHQHTKTFHWTPLNRILELSYGLHTGVTTNQWLLHHVFGHHHNYLDQGIDESRWQRADGSKMGELEYTFVVAATAYLRAWKVGKKHPRHLRTHLIYTCLTVAITILLVVANPMQGFMVFVLPMLTGLLITAWATYDHHAGLDSKDEFSASYNTMNPIYNFVTGNLGYHTAHHHKQGVHWSELPALHKKIEHLIPAGLFRTSMWDLLSYVPGLRGFIRINPT